MYSFQAEELELRIEERLDKKNQFDEEHPLE
jgi:hypothetical protein